MRKVLKDYINPEQLREYTKYLNALIKRGGITRKDLMPILGLELVSINRKYMDQDFTLNEMIIIGNHIGKDFVYDFVDKDLNTKGYNALIEINSRLNKEVEDQAATIVQLKRDIMQLKQLHAKDKS